MVDLQSILQSHKGKDGDAEVSSHAPDQKPTLSPIPDIFFDRVLVEYKLSRVDVLILIYLYRRVYCRPNMYQQHGISQLLSLTDMVNQLEVGLDEIHNCVRKLEKFGFISTIRVGQYFVRRFFTREYDEMYCQTYDDFDV